MSTYDGFTGLREHIFSPHFGRFLDPATGSQDAQTACSLVGFWAGLGWLVLICCERKILLAGWFGLAETNKRTW